MKIKQLFYLGIFVISVSLSKAQDFFTVISERSIKADPKNRTVQPEKITDIYLRCGRDEKLF